MIAEVLRTLGYVNQFSRGVARAEQELVKAGHPPLTFTLEDPVYLNVNIHQART